MYGAELWALWQAARLAMPGASFRTDCLSVLKVFQSGKQAACNSRCKLARVWHGVFASLDDHECSSIDIAWMPAHTTPAEVGIASLSDGSRLTANDRRGNNEADRLAKCAAEWHRVPDGTRKQMAVKMEIATQLRRWIGQATATAGNFTAPDGTVWRDSKPADRRLRVERSPTVRDEQPAAAAQPAIPPQQRWARAVRERASGESTLRHDTHRVIVAGGVTYCDRCGAYAETRGRGLARPCRGTVSGGNRVGRPLKDVQARLRALRAGRHPTTRVDLDAGAHARTGTPAAGHPGRERSRSSRRAHACRSVIAAINGEDPPSCRHPSGASASTTDVRRGGRVPHPTTVRQAALCRMLVIAATASEAAAMRTHEGSSAHLLGAGGLWWITAGLAACALAALLVAAVRASGTRHGLAPTGKAPVWSRLLIGAWCLYHCTFHYTADTLDLGVGLWIGTYDALRPAVDGGETRAALAASKLQTLGMPVRPLPHFRALAPRWGSLACAPARSVMERSRLWSGAAAWLAMQWHLRAPTGPLLGLWIERGARCMTAEKNEALWHEANDVEAFYLKLGMPVRPLPHFRAPAPRWGSLTAAPAMCAMRRSKIRAALCLCAPRQAAAGAYWATAGPTRRLWCWTVSIGPWHRAFRCVA